MTQLRRQMLKELERRNYSANTIRVCLRSVEEHARYFKRRPDQLGPKHIREYQAHLFRDRQLGANTVAQRLTGLRFFYFKTLRRGWDLSLTPYPKKPRRLPRRTPKSFSRSRLDQEGKFVDVGASSATHGP